MLVGRYPAALRSGLNAVRSETPGCGAGPAPTLCLDMGVLWMNGTLSIALTGRAKKP
jgi:hypothetical protein